MIITNPKTKLKVENRKRRNFKKFMKLFNKCLPCRDAMTPFENRFELITKLSKGATSPEQLIQCDFSLPGESVYTTEYDGCETEEVLYTPQVDWTWSSQRMIFRHPDIEYQRNWLHLQHGETCSRYYYVNSTEAADRYLKGMKNDSYRWNEWQQYCSDMECFRKPFKSFSSIPNNSSRSLQYDLETAVMAGGPGLSAISSRWLTHDDLANTFGTPTIYGSQMDCYPGTADTVPESFIFYDTMRRGVYFHLCTDRRVLAEYIDHKRASVNTDTIVQYWNEGASDMGGQCCPFLVIVNAATPITFRTRTEHCEAELNLQKISKQYLNLFQIWLTQQFNPGSQLQYSITQDSTSIPMDNIQQTSMVDLKPLQRNNY